MTRPLVLLTGATGQVGWELARTLAPIARVAAPGSGELDLGSADALRDAVRTLAPAAIVNAAAYTAVDRAESEPERAEAVNAAAPAVLAREAARLGALMVQISTDYVFDGEADAPYAEDAPVNPLSVYGRTKLAGEAGVAAAGGPHLVFRTSWVYGARGANFMRTMLRLAREREELRVVDDQHGAPTWSRMLAQGVAAALGGALRGGRFEVPPEHWGVHHLSAGGQTTWHGFARAILEGDPDRAGQRCRAVVAIPTSQFPTPARRPRYSVLDGTRAARAFGVALPEWREQLALCLAR